MANIDDNNSFLDDISITSEFDKLEKGKKILIKDIYGYFPNIICDSCTNLA